MYGLNFDRWWIASNCDVVNGQSPIEGIWFVLVQSVAKDQVCVALHLLKFVAIGWPMATLIMPFCNDCRNYRLRFENHCISSNATPIKCKGKTVALDLWQRFIISILVQDTF